MNSSRWHPPALALVDDLQRSFDGKSPIFARKLHEENFESKSFDEILPKKQSQDRLQFRLVCALTLIPWSTSIKHFLNSQDALR